MDLHNPPTGKDKKRRSLPVRVAGAGGRYILDTVDYHTLDIQGKWAEDDEWDREHNRGRWYEPSPWEIMDQQAKEAQKEARDRESAAYWDQFARDRDARFASYSEAAEPELPSTDYGQASASSSYIPQLLPKPNVPTYDLTVGDEPEPATVITVPDTPSPTPQASSSWKNMGHSLWGQNQTKEIRTCWSQARGDQIMGGFGVF